MQNPTVYKNKNITRLASAFIAGCLCLSSAPATVYAQSVSATMANNINAMTEESQLKKDIQEVTQMIEEVFSTQLQEKEAELKNLIMEKGYDYTLTMETFYGNGNPYQDVDYTELIAIYSSIKEYCLQNGTPFDKGFGDIDFLHMEITEKSLKETEPVLVENYKPVSKKETDVKRESETDNEGSGDESKAELYERDGNRVIETEETVGIYEKTENGNGKYYIRTGERTVSPKEVEIPYAEITLCYIGNEKLYELFDIPEDKVREISDAKEDIMTAEVNGNTLSQSVFVQIPADWTTIADEDKAVIEELLKQVNGERQDILLTALSLVGSVPYQWGGKASMPGYDNSWYLYDENGEQKGLDCSGFVQWVFMTCGYNTELTDKLLSTEIMLAGLEDTSYEELQPGDIGLLNHGETINHTGIYLGEGYFIHCSSEKKTVTVNKFPFRYFKKVLNEKNNVDKTENSSYLNNEYTNSVIEPFNYANSVITEQSSTEFAADSAHVREEDILLLAQLIQHEAGNQGYNGKVAVGEVVLNRVSSPVFAQNTIHDVIYADGQFSYVERISSITPEEDTMAIARLLLEGKIRIFNNTDVLFYRNPMITSGIAPTEQVNWGKHTWYAAVNEHAFYTK